jgi:tetratricopeptide (TPR) repeat protein
MLRQGSMQCLKSFYQKVRDFIFIYLNILFLIFSSAINIQAKEPEIVILVSAPNAIYSKGITGFESAFYQKTRIVYVNEIIGLGENGSNFFTEYDNANLPFMITFGLEATQLALSQLNSTPILHSFIHSSRKLHTGNKKICGFDLKPSLKEYYDVLKELKPEASKVYSFYSTNLGEYAAKENEYLDVFHGMYSISQNVSSTEEFVRLLEGSNEDMDAFLMVADPIYDRTNFEILSNFCKEKGIVLMTIYPALVDMGATFAIVPDYTSVGEQTGRFATQVYDGKIQCKMGPTLTPSGQILYFNETYAQASGLLVSESVRKKVNEDELLSLGLELYYKKLYQSAKNAFQKLLDKNSTHELAKHYLSQLKFRLTKTETTSLTKTADAYFQKKQYRLANENYSKALRLNPDLGEVKAKLEKSTRLESEEKRSLALQAAKSGKPFIAIKRYQESIAVLPTNQTSKQELEFLRREERPKIPTYFKNALGLYNDRNYTASIEAFENILLIEPNDDTAIEYLRLSRLKKDAMDRLEKCKTEQGSGCELLKK